MAPTPLFRPIVLVRRILFAAAGMAAAVGTQAQLATPTFEVASVKPTESTRGYILTEPGRLTARGRTLASLILRAYNLQDYQLIHGPAVSLAERCDIDAEAPGPAGAAELFRMLQTLLTERFNLVFHRETRELPVFVLSTGKKPRQLDQPKDGETRSMRLEPGPQGDRTSYRLVGRRITLSALASFLGAQLGRSVIDETGLTGEFDFAAEVTAPAAATGVKGTPVDPSSLISAVRANLGLVLESGKRKVDVLVVDHVGKLSPN